MEGVGTSLRIYCLVCPVLWLTLIIKVDQPVGTGFSYVNTNAYLHELPEVSSSFTWVNVLDGCTISSISGKMDRTIPRVS
jgi:hypothetical protein